jgi:hypothetical protein
MIFTIIVLQVWKRFEINTLPGLFSNLIAFGLIGWYWRK